MVSVLRQAYIMIFAKFAQMPKIEPQYKAGLVAAIIAVALIAAVVSIPGANIAGTKTGASTSNLTSASGVSQSPMSTTSSNGQSNSGAFSVFMTDPPTVPNGVSDLFMTYDKVGVHVAGQSNSSGWTVLAKSGTIDLMQAINVSQTIATANLQTGEDFDALGFNITSVVVTYNNGTVTGNYTADLVYGQSRLFVPIPGGISINASEDQSVMIDMMPKVLLLGGPSNPTFAFLPSARGFVVPNGEVSAQSHPFVGQRVSLEGDGWWQSILDNTSFSVTSVVLAENGLSITVQNTGADSIVFHFAAVTSQYSVSGGEMPAPAVSDIFVIEPNATLAQLNVTSSADLVAQLGASGYLLAPGASVTFTYSGSIAFGLQSYFAMQLGRTIPIVSGDNYVVRLFGNGFVAASGATAITSITTSSTTT
jgi:hypothetical protein